MGSSNLKGAGDHMIQSETDVETVFKDECESYVFMAPQHNISLLLQQI